jgi:heme/copper-type cytochrome/quinol oxidase subunit 2
VSTKAQGHQWYWLYTTSDLSSISYESYLSAGPPRLLSSDSSLVIPSSSVLRLLVTAADVLHSWTIPS